MDITNGIGRPCVGRGIAERRHPGGKPGSNAAVNLGLQLRVYATLGLFVSGDSAVLFSFTAKAIWLLLHLGQQRFQTDSERQERSLVYRP